MNNTMLSAVSPLNGFTQNYGETLLKENAQMHIISIATALGQHQQLDQQLKTHFGIGLPAVGKVNRNNQGESLLGLQADQCFMVASTLQNDPVNALAAQLADTAYLSDQSDSWAILELDGPCALPALERICTIDLDEAVFLTDSMARTSMEHLSVIIERPTSSLFRLYSPRSSAQSFLHAVTVSLNNVFTIENDHS